MHSVLTPNIESGLDKCRGIVAQANVNLSGVEPLSDDIRVVCSEAPD